MSEERTAELVRELSRELEPVRPIPALRHALALLLGLWLAVGAAVALWLGFRPDLPRQLVTELGTSAVLAALLAAGVAGLVAGLAGGVPGRERLVRGALGLGLAALAVAAGVGLARVAAAGPGNAMPWPQHLPCLAIACAVGLVPALGVTWYAGRALAFRPLAVAVSAAAGAAAMGAVSAQASCLATDPAHLMLGHVLAPAVGALVLTLPLLLALRRLER